MLKKLDRNKNHRKGIRQTTAQNAMTLEQLVTAMNEKVKKKVDSEVFQAYRYLIEKYLKEGKDAKRLKQRLGEITLVSIPRGERQNK